MRLAPWQYLRGSLVVGLGLVALTACSGSNTHSPNAQGPNASAAGLFPHTDSNQAFEGVRATLVKATAATPGIRAYTFDVDTPKDQAVAFVGDCASGRISVFDASAPCNRGPRALLVMCQGGHFRIKVKVSARQPSKWGAGIYRLSSQSCR